MITGKDDHEYTMTTEWIDGKAVITIDPEYIGGRYYELNDEQVSVVLHEFVESLTDPISNTEAIELAISYLEHGPNGWYVDL